MFVYYYREDTVFDGMPEGTMFKKGIISMISEEDNLADDLVCVELKLSKEQEQNLSFLMYDEETKTLIYDSEQKKAFSLNQLRGKRQPLLNAFDRYNIAVTRGIIQETNKQKIEVLEWYKKILDLDEDAVNNPPKYIIYFIN